MKYIVGLLILTMLCTSCTALPAEERAFAVALAVEKEGDMWRVHARIPTYQTGGGYLTVTGEGDDLVPALSDMEANSPMHVNLSQLRLLAVDRALAEDLSRVLSEMSARSDLRQQCAVAIADVPAKQLMDALKPATGARLSKAIDVMLDARIEQGAILPAALADVVRMGERQSPVLIALTVADGAVTLSGGYALTADMALGPKLSAEETALLSLLMGEAKTLRLTIAEDAAEVRDVSARVHLSEDLSEASVELALRMTTSTLTAEGLEQLLADECLALLEWLTAQGCDVLGLGRQAILRTQDMAAWHELRWPERVQQISWRVSVRVEGMT